MMPIPLCWVLYTLLILLPSKHNKVLLCKNLVTRDSKTLLYFDGNKINKVLRFRSMVLHWSVVPYAVWCEQVTAYFSCDYPQWFLQNCFVFMDVHIIYKSAVVFTFRLDLLTPFSRRNIERRISRRLGYLDLHCCVNIWMAAGSSRRLEDRGRISEMSIIRTLPYNTVVYKQEHINFKLNLLRFREMNKHRLRPMG
jgi:hypothetical protein